MIHRKNNTRAGISASVGIEPNSAASSNNSINNSVYINTPYPNDVKVHPSAFVERDIELHEVEYKMRDSCTSALITTFYEVCPIILLTSFC